LNNDDSSCSRPNCTDRQTCREEELKVVAITRTVAVIRKVEALQGNASPANSRSVVAHADKAVEASWKDLLVVHRVVLVAERLSDESVDQAYEQ
jgi:uncharacterized Rossmann fold enzyme